MAGPGPGPVVNREAGPGPWFNREVGPGPGPDLVLDLGDLMESQGGMV